MLRELCFWTGLIRTRRTAAFSVELLSGFLSVIPRFSVLKYSAASTVSWAVFKPHSVIAPLFQMCKHLRLITFRILPLRLNGDQTAGAG